MTGPKFFHFITALGMASLLFLVACSSKGPIQRNRRGKPTSRYDSRFVVVKKKVALLPFFNESPYGGEDLGITATEEMRKELMRTGEFVIEPTSYKLFGRSKEIYAGGGSKLVQLSRKAKREGINFVLFGRITEARIREKNDEIGFVREKKSYSESKIEVRIFDVHTQKEIFTKTIHGYSEDSTYKFYMEKNEEKLRYRQELLRYGVRVAVRKSIVKILDVAAKMDWVGRVAKIIGNQIYINAGRSSGLHIGDILKVITEGEEIYDPETGALIGMSKGDVKGTIEVIDYFGPDGSISVLHTGGSVTEGDFVKLY